MPKKKSKIKRMAKPVATQVSADVLLEVGTEELPPRSIKALSEALGTQLYRGLRTAGLATRRPAVSSSDRVKPRHGAAAQAVPVAGRCKQSVGPSSKP